MKIAKKVYKKIEYLRNKANNDDILGTGAQLAFHLTLAFFPFLIFLITTVGFFSLDSTKILLFIKNILPSYIYMAISNTVREVIDNQSTGIMWTSIILCVWISSTAFVSVTKGLNRAYGVSENRTEFKIRFMSILYTLLLSLTIISSMILLVFGKHIENFIYKNFNIILSHDFFFQTRLIYTIIALIIIFIFLYSKVPACKSTVKEALPGAIVTTVGWIIMTGLFGLYITNFQNYSKFYGSLGAIFALMMLLYINSIIFLFGGEINAFLLNKYDKIYY